jgi:ADP-ribose pyrophosphatase YjhB (NUDIX family)
MLWKPDVTVAAIIKQQNQYLLVEEHADDRTVFNQPAGHLEKGESLVDAVKREVMEETAREFYPEYLTGIYLFNNEINNTTYIRFCFYGSCSDKLDGRYLDKEILRTVWMSYEQIDASHERLRTPLVSKCIVDYLSEKKFPLSILHSFMPDIG